MVSTTTRARATALAALLLGISSGTQVPAFAATLGVTKPVVIYHDCEFSAQEQATSLPLSNRFDFVYGGGVACVGAMTSVTLDAQLMEGAQVLGSFAQIDSGSNSYGMTTTADLARAFHQLCSAAATIYTDTDFHAYVLFTDGSGVDVHIQTPTTPVVCE
jgi:hypothetical protein